MRKPLLSAKEVAQILGVHPNTVYNWSSKGIGPKRMKIGKGILRYREEDIDNFMVDETALCSCPKVSSCVFMEKGTEECLYGRISSALSGAGKSE